MDRFSGVGNEHTGYLKIIGMKKSTWGSHERLNNAQSPCYFNKLSNQMRLEVNELIGATLLVLILV